MDSDTSEEMPELLTDAHTESVSETSTQPQSIASRLGFWSMLKKNKKKNRRSRDVDMQDSSPSTTESSDDGSTDATSSKGGFWSVVKKHLMKSPEPLESSASGVAHDPIPLAPDPEPLLGATALPTNHTLNSMLETEEIPKGLEDDDLEMTDDLFDSENILPPYDRSERRRSLSFSEQIQLGLDIAQEFITPITPPRHMSGPFGSPFGSPLNTTSGPFGPSLGNLGSRSREFGTAFSSGARPSPFDILSHVLRGHLDNASLATQGSSREPGSDSPPSSSPGSMPDLIPNVNPGETDSSSDDTYVPITDLSDYDSEPPPLLDEAQLPPPELNRSNTESSMAVPLLPGLIYIVVSVDDASLAGLHLLSQLDNSGPPPLSDSKIEQIPTTIITKEQCDNGLQCSICMEDFCIQQSVRVLCCEHCFHNDCIRPWLELHGTCPVCRKTLTNPEDEAASELQNSGSNILNGASSTAHPIPFDTLSQFLQGHLGSTSQDRSSEPGFDSSPLSSSFESMPDLIPNINSSETDSSSDDQYESLPSLSDSDSEPPPLC
ncbi:unnamed protein product [Meganyctiphanes norvegica]|uniref:RING-type E3 ubiquitin transferase n=1 Tax=Meganyctiphanes norvegica TaxID=48144 RepID=A0AAV2R7B2_MEGNR